MGRFAASMGPGGPVRSVVAVRVAGAGCLAGPDSAAGWRHSFRPDVALAAGASRPLPGGALGRGLPRIWQRTGPTHPGVAVNVNLTAPSEAKCTLTAVDAVFVHLA